MIFCSHFYLPNILTLLEFLWQKLQPSINLATSQACFVHALAASFPLISWDFQGENQSTQPPNPKIGQIGFRGIFLWGIYLWMLMIILCNHRNCEDFSISTLVQKFPSAKKWGGSCKCFHFLLVHTPPQKK